MKLTAVSTGPVDVLRLEGRFDAHEVAPVTAWLKDRVGSRRTRIVVNLQGVGFIDSTALTSLVRGLKWCRQGNGELRLCGLQQAVRIIFELTRLDRAFSVHESEGEALAAEEARTD